VILKHYFILLTRRLKKCYSFESFQISGLNNFGDELDADYQTKIFVRSKTSDHWHSGLYKRQILPDSKRSYFWFVSWIHISVQISYFYVRFVLGGTPMIGALVGPAIVFNISGETWKLQLANDF
jgi:hypothetical protein